MKTAEQIQAELDVLNTLINDPKFKDQRNTLYALTGELQWVLGQLPIAASDALINPQPPIFNP